MMEKNTEYSNQSENINSAGVEEELINGVVEPYWRYDGLESLFYTFLKKHGAKDLTEEVRSLDKAYMIGCIMLDTTSFHVSHLYEILKCRIPYNSLRVYLSRLVNEKLIRTASVSGDDEVRKIYYLTKKGYDFFSNYVEKCGDYRPVAKKRKGVTAIHDMGVTAVNYAFIPSPLRFTLEYEVIKAHPKISMPKGKQYRNAVRTDLRIFYSTPYTVGYIYNEHDTGSETNLKALNKLSSYSTQKLLRTPKWLGEMGKWCSDMVLYSFRRKYGERPICFRRDKINRLLDRMDSDTEINSLRKTEVGSIVRSFEKWTPALTDHWKQIDIEWFLKDLEGKVNKHYYAYLLEKQQHFAKKRRDVMIRYILMEYKRLSDLGWNEMEYNRRYMYVSSDEEKNKYYLGHSMEIRDMLEGFPVIACPYNATDRFLRAFFLRSYENTEWLEKAMEIEYGAVEYSQEWMWFAKKRGYESLCVTMHNIFASKDNRRIAVEYLSCDISAIIRLYALHRTVRRDEGGYEAVMIVDSVGDAKDIIDLLGIRCNHWVKFLEYGKTRLFQFDMNGEATYL